MSSFHFFIADGQWDPIVANYSWSMENKYKEEYDSGKVSGKIPASELGKLLMRRAMYVQTLSRDYVTCYILLR
jgi:hypothetical protein